MPPLFFWGLSLGSDQEMGFDVSSNIRSMVSIVFIGWVIVGAVAWSFLDDLLFLLFIILVIRGDKRGGSCFIMIDDRKRGIRSNITVLKRMAHMVAEMAGPIFVEKDKLNVIWPIIEFLTQWVRRGRLRRSEEPCQWACLAWNAASHDEWGVWERWLKSHPRSSAVW